MPEQKITKHFWYDLGMSALLLTFTTLICRLLYNVVFGESIVIMMYLLAVFLISRLTSGYWYGVTSSLLAVLLFNFFFTEPFFSLNVYDARYPLIFAIMLVVSLFTTASTIRIRKAAEDKIEQAKIQEKTRQIIESERMKGTILRSISHDLRTPLTSITGSVSILLDESQELNAADREKLFQDIYQESIWLSRFVENLLSLSRIDDDLLKLQVKPELIEEILGETLVTIRRRLGSRTIKVIIPPQPVLVWLDSALIERVIINLLENAISHTRDDGAITITVTCDREVVHFRFWNNGPIIPPDIINRIFERYFVGNEERFDSRRGMGLGLSICQSIVQAHYGTLTAENCPDGGVAFTFSIPLNGGLNIHDKPDSRPDH